MMRKALVFMLIALAVSGCVFKKQSKSRTRGGLIMMLRQETSLIFPGTNKQPAPVWYLSKGVLSRWDGWKKM